MVSEAFPRYTVYIQTPDSIFSSLQLLGTYEEIYKPVCDKKMNVTLLNKFNSLYFNLFFAHVYHLEWKVFVI